MIKFIFSLIGELLLTILLVSGGSAQSATATLSGTVFDEQNAAVSGAIIKITDNAKAFIKNDDERRRRIYFYPKAQTL